MRVPSRNTITLLLILGVATLHLFNDPINRVTSTYKRTVHKVISTNVVVITELGKDHYGYGSGTIVSSDGYILTANHVIVSTNSRSYLYPDLETPLLIQIVARFPMVDVAILKLQDPPEGLEWAEVADSTDLELMDPVIVVGHPRLLWWTVTTGRINKRYYDIGKNIIQTDAVSGPGSSGGGIFNMDGDLIGIMQAKVSAGPPFPPDGQLNVGIQSSDLIRFLDIYGVIDNHRRFMTVLDEYLLFRETNPGIFPPVNRDTPTQKKTF